MTLQEFIDFTRIRALLHFRQKRHHARPLRSQGTPLPHRARIPFEDLGARIVKDAQTINQALRLRDETPSSSPSKMAFPTPSIS